MNFENANAFFKRDHFERPLIGTDCDDLFRNQVFGAMALPPKKPPTPPAAKPEQSPVPTTPK